MTVACFRGHHLARAFQSPTVIDRRYIGKDGIDRIIPSIGVSSMARLSRLGFLFEEHPMYFVTACTDQRKTLLDNKNCHDHFVDFCQRGRDHGVLVGRYVLMPDHLHLFICITTGALSLSPWMKSLKNSLSKHWRDNGVTAPHWQKGFFDHLIRHDESYAEKWKYVADNPVRAGLCKKPEDWPFSGEINPTAHH